MCAWEVTTPSKLAVHLMTPYHAGRVPTGSGWSHACAPQLIGRCVDGPVSLACKHVPICAPFGVVHLAPQVKGMAGGPGQMIMDQACGPFPNPDLDPGLCPASSPGGYAGVEVRALATIISTRHLPPHPTFSSCRMWARLPGSRTTLTSACAPLEACSLPTTSITSMPLRLGLKKRRSALRLLRGLARCDIALRRLAQDITFLRSVAYPSLDAIADFYLSYVTADDSGTLHVLNSCAQVGMPVCGECSAGLFKFSVPPPLGPLVGEMLWKHHRAGERRNAGPCVCATGELPIWVGPCVVLLSQAHSILIPVPGCRRSPALQCHARGRRAQACRVAIPRGGSSPFPPRASRRHVCHCRGVLGATVALAQQRGDRYVTPLALRHRAPAGSRGSGHQ